MNLIVSKTITDRDHIMIQVWWKKFFVHTMILHDNVYSSGYCGAQITQPDQTRNVSHETDSSLGYWIIMSAYSSEWWINKI